MKITENKKLVDFERVQSGDVFSTSSLYYLKMDNTYYVDGYDKFNAINLYSGMPIFFEPDEKVIVEENAELIV